MAQVKVNQDMYARVFKHLLTDTATSHEVVEITGMHLLTAYSLMRSLHKHKVVHIVGWHADGKDRDTTPIFKMGVGKDVPRRKLTSAQRQARARAKRIALRNQQTINNALAGVSK